VSYPDEYETAIVVIDGPHGAGRSTAMLRMALDCSEAGRNAVAVSVDATRREPADVLAGYAEVMGIDFVGAPDDRSFERAIRKARRGSVLFVDGAPGWTPPAFVTAPVFRYVAVPAHWQSHALKTWMRSAGHGSYAGAIPTFTDIATELTPAVSTLVALGTGIAFLSSGSDISSGIAVADANAIASGIFSMSTGGRTDGRLVASA
jgi:flagellar biosynthesis GTPase FlhF